MYIGRLWEKINTYCPLVVRCIIVEERSDNK